MPVKLTGNSPGVLNGGKLRQNYRKLKVKALAKDLPEFVEVDVANLELGASLHISDIVLPAGVSSVELAKGEAHDQAVVSITAPKGAEEGDSAEEEATEE